MGYWEESHKVSRRRILCKTRNSVKCFYISLKEIILGNFDAYTSYCQGILKLNTHKKFIYIDFEITLHIFRRYAFKDFSMKRII